MRSNANSLGLDRNDIISTEAVEFLGKNAAYVLADMAAEHDVGSVEILAAEHSGGVGKCFDHLVLKCTDPFSRNTGDKADASPDSLYALDPS